MSLVVDFRLFKLSHEHSSKDFQLSKDIISALGYLFNQRTKCFIYFLIKKVPHNSLKEIHSITHAIGNPIRKF